MENLKLIFIGYIVLINLIGFIMMGYDKNRAKKGKWRVSEKKIFIFAFIGGALGIYFGMNTFRHKTKHGLFTYGIPLLIIINLVLYYFVLLNL